MRASNASGSVSQSFKVTVAVAPPATVGTLPDVAYDQNTGVKTVAAAAGFAGEELIFSLTAAPAGVTVAAATGVVSIPTSALLRAATVTVRVSNTAGQASQSFTVTVREQAGSGELPPVPTNALNTAIARPNTVYSNTRDGMTGGALSPWSAVVIAYASLAGQTSADAKVKSQLRSWLSNKGPAAQGNFVAKRDLYAAAAITLAKLTPRIWDDFTTAEVNGLTAIVEGVGVMGASIYSDTYAVAAKPNGDVSNRGGNPNISAAYPALVGVLRAFKGSNAATTGFLDGVDCDTLRAALNTAGVSNMVGTYATSRPAGAPTLAQIENACGDWRSHRASGGRAGPLRRAAHRRDRPLLQQEGLHRIRRERRQRLGRSGRVR